MRVGSRWAGKTFFTLSCDYLDLETSTQASLLSIASALIALPLTLQMDGDKHAHTHRLQSIPERANKIVGTLVSPVCSLFPSHSPPTLLLPTLNIAPHEIVGSGGNSAQQCHGSGRGGGDGMGALVKSNVGWKSRGRGY